MFSIYILELENGKYYVGKTKDTNNRIKKHFKGYGSEYTRKYKPVKIDKIHYNSTDELKYTLEYMKKYGIDNVRGGPFVKLILPKEYVVTIKQIISSEEDRCFNCGEKGHFVRDCKLIKKHNELNIIKPKVGIYGRIKNMIFYMIKYINFYFPY